jgi:type VI protein secretion system component Hcp
MTYSSFVPVSFAMKVTSPADIVGTPESEGFEPGSIPILSFDLGLEVPAGSSKAVVKDLTVIKAIDVTSSKLMAALCSRTPFDLAIKAFLPHGTTTQPTMTYTFEAAELARLDWDGRVGDVPVETIVLRLTSATVRVEFRNGSVNNSAMYAPPSRA